MPASESRSRRSKPWRRRLARGSSLVCKRYSSTQRPHGFPIDFEVCVGPDCPTFDGVDPAPRPSNCKLSVGEANCNTDDHCGCDLGHYCVFSADCRPGLECGFGMGVYVGQGLSSVCIKPGALRHVGCEELVMWPATTRPLHERRAVPGRPLYGSHLRWLVGILRLGGRLHALVGYLHDGSGGRALHGRIGLPTAAPMLRHGGRELHRGGLLRLCCNL